MGPHVSRADLSVARAEQSAVLNPRGDEVREAQPRLRNALTGLEHCYVVLRTLCREIFDRTLYLPPDLETEVYARARAALADGSISADAMIGVPSRRGRRAGERPSRVQKNLVAARGPPAGRLLP